MEPFSGTEPFGHATEHERLIELAHACANQTRVCVGETKELIESTRRYLATLRPRPGWSGLRYRMPAMDPPPDASREQVDFLLTDSRAGLTFLRLAREAHDVAARARHLHHAEQALDAVTHHAARVTLTAGDASILEDLLHELAAGIDAVRLRLRDAL